MLKLGTCEPALLSRSHNSDVILFSASQSLREGAVLLTEDNKCVPDNPWKRKKLRYSKIL